VTGAEILRRACGTRFAAAVLRVERGGAVVSERAFGCVDDSAGAAAIDVTARFDLASLTKLFVAGAALRAVAAGTLALDAPLLALIPEWTGRAQAAITLRMLLAHTSGMQSGADYRTLFGENVEQFALRRELASPPGERVLYSDLGFITLGVVLARSAGRGLPTVLARSNAAFGANDVAFRPTRARRGSIPATELDLWRGRVRGTVHDEKAHLLNGIAGHAGLFGTAADVAALTEAFLAPATGRYASNLPATPAPPLPAGLAREDLPELGADPVLRRGLGWALKTSDANSCGPAMSRATFGHTGFTGTSVWADPVRDLSIVLLTNAVYFGRNDLRDVRTAVCTAVVEEADRCARSA
jgi:CubicO group peptidase (beta-lactamase class C family)